ncbi:MAG TPA: M14 family zinc carboxypeptidase, partial [Herpetosiphonaceae bacterium]
MRQAVGRWRMAVLIAVMILGWALGAAGGTRATLAQETGAKAAQQEAMVVRIRVANAKQQAALAAQGLDLLEMRDGKDLFAMVTPKEFAALQAAGFDVRVDDAQTDTMRSKAGFDNVVQGGYRTVEEGYALLNTWQTTYPNLAQAFTYGQSWDKKTASGPAGYDLRGITITNKLIPGPKPTFVLISAIHAREMATAELSLRFAEYLVTRYNTDPEVTWLLNEHQVVIMPFTNPDGRKDAETGIYQRKNKNTVTAPCSSQNSSSQPGIDLNRNSHFKWGTVDMPSQPKCSATYPGPSVASEPEVSSLEAWISKVFIDQRGPNDSDPAPVTARDIFITLHSYGDLVLWPYGWGSTLAPNDADLAGLGRKFASYNNYTAEKADTLYPTSGATDDWTYGDFGVASYTFEVGAESGTCGGFFPTFSCLDGGTNGNIWGRNLPAFLYATKVARAPYQLQRGPDALSAAVASVSGGYRVTATINDTKNGNQAINAAELYVDTPPWRGGAPVSLSATDGAFNSTAEAVQGTLTGVAAGRHLVYVRGRDTGGNWGPVSAAWLDVSAGGTGTLSGRVTTADNGAAAAGVTVTATAGSTSATAVSDAGGNYSFTLGAG